MSMEAVTIDIIRDGKRFGIRTWRNVPRVGDTIMLENNQGFVEVERVIWANDRDYDCWAQLLCKTVNNIKAV